MRESSLHDAASLLRHDRADRSRSVPVLDELHSSCTRQANAPSLDDAAVHFADAYFLSFSPLVCWPSLSIGNACCNASLAFRRRLASSMMFAGLKLGG